MAADPTFFPSAADFRRWLQKHHRTAEELWVGYYKKGSGRPSITRHESVDEALCFGWIDGLGKSLDADRYMVRFTPRRKGSVWSAVNTRRMKELIRLERVRAAGAKAFAARDEQKTHAYSVESRERVTFDPALEAKFKANKAAWAFYQAQPPGYRRLTTSMVMSAKQEATRLRRIEILIAHSALGRRLDFMKPLRMPTGP
jgi:uncharacterized protein YdeI (YjbR/CyaY-like superfamily)